MIRNALVFVSILMLVAPAASADEKTFTAAFCQEVGRNQHWFDQSPDGRLYNRDAVSSRNLVCPVVRDRTEQSSNWTEVTVLDRHYNSNITCTFYSVERTHANGWWRSASTQGSSVQWQTLRVSNNLSEHDQGSYYFLCSIPPIYQGNASGIASYLVNERD